MRGIRLATGALTLAAAFASTGCATGGDVRTVTIDVRHSRFSLEEVAVRPGQTVRFVVRNTDPIPHELIIGDASVQDVHEAGIEAHHDDRRGEVSVGPGRTATTTYRFGPNPVQLLFGCHLPGHWAYGMRGAIRVG